MRVGLSDVDSHMRVPGDVRPSIEPVLGQVAVIDVSAVEPHIGKEALVALEERPGDERGRKQHGSPG